MAGGEKARKKDAGVNGEGGTPPKQVSSGTLAVVAVLMLLVMAVVAGYIYTKEDIGGTGDTVIEVSGAVDGPAEFTLEDLLDLPTVTVSLRLKGTGEDETLHTYEGVAVHALMDECGVSADVKTLVVRASDGYGTSFKYSDLAGRDDALFAYSVDGRSIPGAQEAGDGPVRLIVSQDIVGEYNAQRCVKRVSQVIAED